MKILKENKEELPISFLTAFISKGWDEVGILKEDIKAIREAFKGTKKIEELIQSLVDAYLVCIGQMELHMKNNDYLEFPIEEQEVKESLQEDVFVKVDSPIVKADNYTTCSTCASEELPAVEYETDIYNDKDIINDDAEVIADRLDNDSIDNIEDDDFICDFEDADLTDKKLTDEDIYPEEK